MEMEASRGRPFEVTVEQYGAAGYVWEVESAPPAVRQLDSATSPGEANESPGAPRSRTFRFVADEDGEHEIVLAAKRPWEAEPAERRSFRIRVAAAG